jgi:hypothetical protein
MHKTPAGEQRKALIKDARELARNAKALKKAAKHLPAGLQEAHRLQEEANEALAQAEALKIQARLEDLLQDIHLLDGLLERGRQDTKRALRELRKDGCRSRLAEGQKDKSRGNSC